MKCYFALAVLQSFLINKLWGKFCKAYKKYKT